MWSSALFFAFVFATLYASSASHEEGLDYAKEFGGFRYGVWPSVKAVNYQLVEKYSVQPFAVVRSPHCLTESWIIPITLLASHEWPPVLQFDSPSSTA